MAVIAEQIEPEAATVGNGYVPGTGHGPDFPRVMPEAITRLRASKHARGWLGDAFVDSFTATRAAQEAEFQAKVPDTELHRFFELG